MSIRLARPTPAASEDEPEGHDYRLNPDQFARMVEAGIILESDRVGLHDGFLRSRSTGGGPDAEVDYRLSVDQYHAMVREDILTTDDRVELLEGWLVAKMTKKPPHTISKGSTQAALLALLPAGWFLAVEDPVTALDSEPEPDLASIRGTCRDYPDKAPGPREVALLVEVAHASLLRDSVRKKRLYARSSFPIYWLINLVNRRIEVYTGPSGPVAKPDYSHRQDLGPDDMIPLVIEGREVGRIAVRDLLP